MSAVAVPGNISPTISRVNIPIGGMTCASCASRVEKSVRKVAGVVDVSVNLATETANVITSGDVPRLTLETAVIDAGYPVAKAKVTDPRASSSKTARNCPPIDNLRQLPPKPSIMRLCRAQNPHQKSQRNP